MKTLREYLASPSAIDPAVSIYTRREDKPKAKVLTDYFRPQAVVGSPPQIPWKNSLVGKRGVCICERTDASPPRDRLIPIEVSKLFVHNMSSRQDGRCVAIPAGRDFRSRQAFSNTLPVGEIKKSSWVYLNFSTNTHRSRRRVFNSLKSHPLVTAKHGGRYRNYPLTRAEFSQDLLAHRFVVCPRGSGLDSFRFWDTLCCGGIPIIAKGTQPDWPLPSLIVDPSNWKTALTEQSLEQAWSEALETVYDFRLLRMDYWVEACGIEPDSLPVSIESERQSKNES